MTNAPTALSSRRTTAATERAVRTTGVTLASSRSPVDPTMTARSAETPAPISATPTCGRRRRRGSAAFLWNSPARKRKTVATDSEPTPNARMVAAACVTALRSHGASMDVSRAVPSQQREFQLLPYRPSGSPSGVSGIRVPGLASSPDFGRASRLGFSCTAQTRPLEALVGPAAYSVK